MKEVLPVKLASFCYKKLGKNRYVTKAEWQFPTYKEFLAELWKVYDENDLLIGHNIRQFDQKQSNTFFGEYGFPKYSKVSYVDTLTIVRNNFRLPTYKLAYCLKFFGLGEKIETGGQELWFKVEAGDEKARAHFLAYNKNDSVQTEKFYFFLKDGGWIANHPGGGHYTKEDGCPRCASHDVHKRGEKGYKEGVFQMYYCKNCNKHAPGELVRDWNYRVIA